jgi:putative membrane-bound dehydrogenase-like protein
MVPGIVPAAPPVCVDERLIIELVAEQPDIVTPTGLAVDERGQIWVIENQTHQRPAGYNGPPSDRIRVFSDFDAAGKAKKITTFADGFKNSMGIAFGKNGIVYFATRSEVYILRDKDGDGVCDEKKLIVKLESKGDYPHNGLSGFAFDGMGDVYFALGENLGATYKLVGSDGSSESGGGEGGSIYRCKPDGSKLTRVATGFWNTFHLTFDAFGRLFAVDNDPDSRGPCRLLHIVQGGDYGYRYRNGRKGLHPFTSWNGELTGTLPMVAGTAEAPSGILAYESNAFPAEYRGKLFATSWGDHVIDAFTLMPRGASFGAKQQTLVRGGENFRPVGIVQGPDGCVYVSDWVDRSYPVHGKGAIWRIRPKERVKDDGLRASKVAEGLGLPRDIDVLEKRLNDPRREIREAAADAIIATRNWDNLNLPAMKRKDPVAHRATMQTLWALAKNIEKMPRIDRITMSGTFLLGTAEQGINPPDIRAEALRLHGELTGDNDEALLKLVKKEKEDPFVRRQAMALLQKPESLKALVPFLGDDDPFLMGTALERLGRKGNTELLRPHAFDKNPKLRVGVLLALRRAGEPEGRDMIRAFLADSDPEVRRAAIQWVGEDQLKDFAPLLGASAAKLPVTRELFESYLGALDFLQEKRDWNKEGSGEEFIIKILQDAKQPKEIHTIALRMIRPDHPGLTAALLESFLKAPDNEKLHLEAARTLALRSDVPSQQLLYAMAVTKPLNSKPLDPQVRQESLAGLAQSASAAQTQNVLLYWLGEARNTRRDAIRSLREVASQDSVEKSLTKWWDENEANLEKEERTEFASQMLLALRASKSAEAGKRRAALAKIATPRPANEADWKKLLAEKGDPESGRRVFFHKNGPRCFACHRVDGRGGKLGPDLSKIGKSAPRDKIIESILTPSKEIAPLFVAWNIITSDGKTYTGLIVEEGSIGGKPGTVTLANAEGKITVLKRADIEERHALATSIMPDNLPEQMTPREFVDLIEFLTTLK